jgi:hypothetical protein
MAQMNHMKVLLLEEEPIVRWDIAKQLRQNGCQVSDDFTAERFDCVIVGQVHFLNTVGKKLRGLGKNVRFIFFTTQSEASSFKAYNNSVVVSKPAHADVLLNYLKPSQTT